METRKSSCVNARGIPTAAYQVLHLLPEGGTPLGRVPPPPARSDRGVPEVGYPPPSDLAGVPPPHLYLAGVPPPLPGVDRQIRVKTYLPVVGNYSYFILFARSNRYYMKMGLKSIYWKFSCVQST